MLDITEKVLDYIWYNRQIKYLVDNDQSSLHYPPQPTSTIII